MNRINTLRYLALMLFCLWCYPLHAEALKTERDHSIKSIADRLHHPQAKDSQPVRIMHIGDSHVKGGSFAEAIGSKLAQVYGERCTYQSVGINGATYQTWLAEKNINQIVSAKPDLLIISLGTNDSYSTRFSPEVMHDNMLALYAELQKHLPKLCIVYTTPPANYLHQSKRVVRGTVRRKNGKRRTTYRYAITYTFNEQTDRARKLIQKVAQEQAMHSIDLNSYIGNKAQAISWLKQGLMHQDHVHYTAAGYSKQGQWLADELLKTLEAHSLDTESND